MIYLASPYSNIDPSVVEMNYQEALQCTGALLSRGLPVFSPVVHNHEASRLQRMPGHFDFWQRYNFAFLRRCDSLYVMVENPELVAASKGVQAEIALARTLMLQIHHVDAMGFEVL